MGNSSSVEDEYSLLTNYKIVRQENCLKVLEEKQTEQTFILKEQCFVNKIQYDKVFKALTTDNNPNCQNVIKMVKLWSKQHNSLCSNLFKIYSVFQYPKVKLLEQIQARQKQSKYFEETELFSIIQSCISAVKCFNKPFCLSPSYIFIIPQGIIKIIHPELLDLNYNTVYNQNFYYAPEKIQNFSYESFHKNDIEKQIIFSIGMTALHSALLQSLVPCYQINHKRLNLQKITHYLSSLKRQYSSALLKILERMLRINPSQRGSIEQIQSLINEYFEHNQSSLMSRMTEIKPLLDFEKNILQSAINESLGKDQKVSQFQAEVAQNNQSDQKKTLNEIQNVIISQQSNKVEQNLPKSHQILQKIKKTKGKKQPIEDQENQGTELKIMQMIKTGVKNINNSSKRKALGLQDSNNKIENNMKPKESTNKILSRASSKDYFNDFELISNNKVKCTFMIQSYEDNTIYQGMILNGNKNGYGKIIYPDGAYFEGNFKNDKINGRGTLYYGKDRPAYIGDWLEDKFHGKGILYNEYPIVLENQFDFKNLTNIGDYWMRYEGEFVEDKQEGLGKLTLTNGQYIEGHFTGGNLEGEGIINNQLGNKIDGLWKNNVRIK